MILYDFISLCLCILFMYFILVLFTLADFLLIVMLVHEVVFMIVIDGL